jgi:hypothetical protein
MRAEIIMKWIVAVSGKGPVVDLCEYGDEPWVSTKGLEFISYAETCRVLRRIFGPKLDEMVGGWRKLLNEELHNL